MLLQEVVELLWLRAINMLENDGTSWVRGLFSARHLSLIESAHLLSTWLQRYNSNAHAETDF